MKIPRKMKLVKDLADELIKEEKEVTSDSLNRKAMGYVASGHHLAGKYESITPSEVSRFMREFYEPLYKPTV